MLLALALTATALLGVLVAATMSAHGDPTTWAAALHHWTLAHRPRTMVDVAIAVTASGTGWAALRLAVCALPALWALAVSASCVHIRMHWLGDVVAGRLLTAAWTGILAALAMSRTPQRTTTVTGSSTLQGRNS
jgi:hypothetical protein